MLQPGRKYSGGSGYCYGFNGKENDNDIKGAGNQQDYGLRIYDTRIGRFLSVDPLAQSFPWNSAFSYSEGDPINYIDLDGGEQPINRAQAVEIPAAPVFVTPRGGFSPNSNPTQLINGPVNTTLLNAETKGNVNLNLNGHNYYGVTEEQIKLMIPLTATSAKIGSDGTGYCLQGEDQFGLYSIPLYKSNGPKIEDWVVKAAHKLSADAAKLFNTNKWNADLQIVEIITTDPASLSDAYLEEVNRRLLNGTATDNDRLYANEVALRKQDNKIKDPEKIEFIQGRGDNAKKITAYIPKGYRKTSLKSHNQVVYTNGRKWISPDQDGHKGGVWKMFDQEKNVNSTDKAKRVGTYDGNLKRVDD